MLNATLTDRSEVTPELIIFKVKPDSPIEEFSPGQYLALGILGSAPRPAHFPPEIEPAAPDKLVKRAYSICSSPAQKGELEFYIGILPLGALTSRLVIAKPGDRLFVTPKITGTFTLRPVPAESNLVLIAMGTGVAPYISMLRTPGTWTAGRRITLVYSARFACDLAYFEELSALATARPEFTFLPTVTRDDPKWDGARGRVQTLVERGLLAPNPATDHVFLCGNSNAISDCEALLVSRGFVLHTKKVAGNVHEERYD